jgi:hypothetical protein
VRTHVTPVPLEAEIMETSPRKWSGHYLRATIPESGYVVRHIREIRRIPAAVLITNQLREVGLPGLGGSPTSPILEAHYQLTEWSSAVAVGE